MYKSYFGKQLREVVTPRGTLDYPYAADVVVSEQILSVPGTLNPAVHCSLR
jgi:hypothetical protein